MDIYEELQKDHVSIMLILKELIGLSETNQQRRHHLVNKLSDELIPHARAEEAILYNSIRMMEAGKQVVMNGYREHFDAEVILRTLQLRERFNFNWKSAVHKLNKVIEQHFETEESEIFAAAKIFFTEQEAAVMGMTFKSIKSKIKGKGIIGTTRAMLFNLLPPRMMNLPSEILSPRFQRWLPKAY